MYSLSSFKHSAEEGRVAAVHFIHGNEISLSIYDIHTCSVKVFGVKQRISSDSANLVLHVRNVSGHIHPMLLAAM